MTNRILIETIRQARQTEATLTDAHLAGKVPEHDVIISMKSVDILVEIAIQRGLMKAPFDTI
jgi:hypothetical protein